MALGITTDQACYIPKGPSIRVGKFTLDNAYVNGTGYAITAANFGFTVLLQIIAGNAAGFVSHWTGTNLKMYKTGAAVSTILAECANNEAGLNNLTVPFIAVGY